MNKKMKSIKRTRNSTNGSEQRNGRTKKSYGFTKIPSIETKKSYIKKSYISSSDDSIILILVHYCNWQLLVISSG
jgi:hypothetical protein